MKGKAILAMMLALTASDLNAQVIDVKYSNGQAAVSIPADVPDVTATCDGAYVTINSTTAANEYTYRVSGSTNNGGLVINGGYKLTLELDGASIKSQRGAAVDVQCGKRIKVVVNEGTTNTLSDQLNGTHKAALYFTGHPEFEGAGTLNVTGNTKHAISAKEYLQIKKDFGTLNIQGAVSDGIHCGKEKVQAWDETMTLNEHEFFRCSGGNINISNCGGDCVDTGMYGCILIKGGALNFNVDAYDVCALKSPNTFIMEDGQLNITLTGGSSDGIYANREVRLLGGDVVMDVRGNGSKGIKGKLKDALYAGGGNVLVQGSQVDIVARGGDDATDPEDISHCVAVSVDGNLTCDNMLTVTAVGDAKGVTCDGTKTGTPNERKLHWYAHPYDYQYDMTLYLTLQLDGKTIQPADAEVAAFVNGKCRGVAEAVYGMSGVYYLRVRSNSMSGEAVSFMAYVNGEEKSLGSSEPVVFESGKTIALPTAPMLLSADAAVVPPVVAGAGPVPTSFCGLSDNIEVYIYNVSANQFMTFGNKWGTQTSTGYRGSSYTLSHDENGWRIYSNDPLLDRDSDRRYVFLEYETSYQDWNPDNSSQVGCQYFDIVQMDNGYYRIRSTADNAKYGTPARGDAYYHMWLGLPDAGTTATRNDVDDNGLVDWAFVTPEVYGEWEYMMNDYNALKDAVEEALAKSEEAKKAGFDQLAVRLVYLANQLQDMLDSDSYTHEDCAAASRVVAQTVADYVSSNAKAGDDVTILLNNPSFSTDFSAWQYTGKEPSWGGIYENTDGVKDENGNVKYPTPTESGNAEVYHATFNMFQTIKNMPAGVYTVTCQAFERDDNGKGMEAKLYAVVDGKEQSVSVKDIFSESSEEDLFWRATNEEPGSLENRENPYMGGFIPHTMSAANVYFANGYYRNTLRIAVLKTGDITIGIKTDSGGDWVLFDDFKVLYEGDDESSWASILDARITEAETLLADNSGNCTTPAATDLNKLVQNGRNIKDNGNTEQMQEATMSLNKGIDAFRENLQLVTKANDACGRLDDTKESYWDAVDYDPELEAEFNAVYDIAIDANKYMQYTSVQLNAFLNRVNSVIDKFEQFGVSDEELKRHPWNMSEATQDKPVDATQILLNADLNEGAKVGWNYTKRCQNGPNYNGFNGTPGMEFWDSDAAYMQFNFWQTLWTLPKGSYTLGVTAANSLNGKESNNHTGRVVLYAAVVVESGDTIVNSVPVNVQKESCTDIQNDYAVSFYVPSTARKVLVGVKTEGTMEARWFAADDFTLKYYGQPDHLMYVENQDVKKGSVTMVPVILSNSEPIVALQCNVEPGNGLSVAVDEYGDYAFELSDRADKTMCIASSDKEGKVFVLSYSTKNNAFAGNDGALFYIPVEVSEDVEVGTVLPIRLSNILLTKKVVDKEQEFPISDAVAQLTVKPSYKPGDVNGDGIFTAADIVLTVEFVLGKSPANGVKEAADANGDGDFTAVDIVLVVEHVLKGK